MTKPVRSTALLSSMFFTFLKIGTFTFGGGYAMIPLIQKYVVEKKQWISEGELLDLVAIAESTPGPIAINAATFVGYRTGGFRAALAATLGVVLPSFSIIALLSLALHEFQDQPLIQSAFFGIRAGVLALMIKALLSMYRQCPRYGWSYVLMAAAFVLTAFFHVHVLLIIIGCAAVGAAWVILADRRAKK